jgi:hypothetical protein
VTHFHVEREREREGWDLLYRQERGGFSTRVLRLGVGLEEGVSA